MLAASDMQIPEMPMTSDSRGRPDLEDRPHDHTDCGVVAGRSFGSVDQIPSISALKVALGRMAASVRSPSGR